jgi:excisionase family DNA binding protein
MASDAVNGEPMLTIAEVADLVRVSKLAIYRLVENGELPVQRMGRSLRVPGSGLRAYLETVRRG